MADHETDESTQQRAVRVFVSSTFRDMHAERDELVKTVFPQLRQFCEDRGVTWTNVDLRWGITEEQSAEGEVLPICLAEIQRCRPYFIGLLGELYGWVPQEVDPELVREQRWLAEHRDKSVTELEILHGVLNEPAMANRACFYFRDPAYVESLPANRRIEFVESDPQGKLKLLALKALIRRSGQPVRENYPDPRTLGQWVLKDLTAAIDSAFPSGSEPDELGRERTEHGAVAQAHRHAYIGRRDYFDRLDEHAGGTVSGSGLVVLGESGIGKSALLANWALDRGESNSGELLLIHFIGGTPRSADWTALIRRILGEFKRRFDIDDEIPDDPEALRSAFANWLQMAGARGRVVLILDALNQLEDRDAAPDLGWLPRVVPGNIRVIVSGLPGRAMDVISKWQWPTLEIQPLSLAERERFIREYLAEFSQSLLSAQVRRIASADQAATPLYLKALLEELRVVGRHECLEEQIADYLRSPDASHLYGRILERYECDYDGDWPGLVRDAMRLIWASRHGLSEVELLDMLNPGEGLLPQAAWSPVYLAADRHLVNRSGLITFAHEHLRQAVRRRYLGTVEEQIVAHQQIANYFENRPTGHRKLGELPWQQTRAGDWPGLRKTLSDLVFLEALWAVDQFETLSYWTEVEQRLGLVSGNVLLVDWREQARAGKNTQALAELLSEAGNRELAGRVLDTLIERARATDDTPALVDAIVAKAAICQWHRHFGQASSLYGEAVRLLQHRGHQLGLSRILGRLAACSSDQDPRESLRVLGEQEAIARKSGFSGVLQECLHAQALIHAEHRQDLPAAIRCCEEGNDICGQNGLHVASISHRLSLAIFKYRAGLLDQQTSLGELDAVLGDAQSAGANPTVARCRDQKGMVLSATGRYDDAMREHNRAELLWREADDRVGLVACLTQQSLVLGKLRRRHQARRKAEIALQVMTEGDWPRRTVAALAVQVRRLQGVAWWEAAGIGAIWLLCAMGVSQQSDEPSLWRQMVTWGIFTTVSVWLVRRLRRGPTIRCDRCGAVMAIMQNAAVCTKCGRRKNNKKW